MIKICVLSREGDAVDTKCPARGSFVIVGWGAQLELERAYRKPLYDLEACYQLQIIPIKFDFQFNLSLQTIDVAYH